MKTPTHFLSAALLLFGLVVLAGCEKPEEKLTRYMNRGNELYEQGEYEKARVEYKNALKLNPTGAEVRFRIGLIDETEGNLRNAFANFVAAEQQDGHFHPALLKIAEYYLAADQTDQAQRRINTVLIDTPDYADAHAMRAALFFRQKNFDETEKEARIALQKEPNNVVAYTVLTGLYNAQDNMDKALATVEEGITKNPKEISLQLLKASLYRKTGNIEKVAEAYNVVFGMRPKETRYRVELAETYLTKKQIDEAEKVLRDGVAAQPDDWILKRQLAMFLGDFRGVDASEKEIRSYMKDAPDNDELPFWIVDLYLTHKMNDRAEAYLQELNKQYADRKPGLNARAMLGMLYLAKGDKQQANSMAASVLEKDSGNLRALLVRANIEFGEGRYQSVISDLRTALRDNPQARDAYPLLAETLLRQGHTDLAIDTLKQLLDLSPLDQRSRIRLAQIYQASGDNKHALELLERVTSIEPSSAPAWETTARVAISKKDWDAAKSAIDKLDKLDGQHLAATLLRGDMAEGQNKNDEAIAAYKQVADADPSAQLAQPAIVNLADIYKKSDRMADLAAYLEKLKPETPFIATALGESYLAIKKTDEATAAFDRAIASHSLHQDTYLDRARIYLVQQKPDQAIATLKQGAEVAPDDMRAPLMQAEILSAQKKYREAIAIYEDILARNPDLDAVANNLAETIADDPTADSQMLDRARKTAERFVGSPNPMMLDTLAWVYYKQGELQQAQTIMERAMSGDAKLPPQIHYHYGAILVKSGKGDAAKPHLQEAVKDSANYPGVEDARKLLDSLSKL